MTNILTPQTPRTACAVASVAQATFPPTTNPGNVVLLITAGAQGGRYTGLTATPQENVTANNLQLFSSIDGGTTKNFIAGATGAADTVSAVDGPNTVDFGYSEDNPLYLQANEKLYVATGISKSYIFRIQGGDY
jgi:hypothetical protein